MVMGKEIFDERGYSYLCWLDLVCRGISSIEIPSVDVGFVLVLLFLPSRPRLCCGSELSRPGLLGIYSSINSGS